LVFDGAGQAYLTDGEVLLTPEAARTAMAPAEAPAGAVTKTGPADGEAAEPEHAFGGGGDGATPRAEPGGPQAPTGQAGVTRFYGATDVDPIRAKGAF